MSYPGWENYTPPSSQPVKAKRSKYGAVKTEIDGVTFASQREAARYVALQAELKAGAIQGLELQPQFPLHVCAAQGAIVAIGRYIADFRYQREGREVYEDAKGMKTALYLWKKKHVESEYGIQIIEV